MKPYYDSDGIQIWNCDCRDVLPTLAPGSVQLVLTDPPYGIKDAPIPGNRGATNDWHPPSHWDVEFPSDLCRIASEVAPVMCWFGNWRNRPLAEAASVLPIACEIIWVKDTHVSPPCPAAMQDERLWVFGRVSPERFETTVWNVPIIPTWEHKHHKNEKPLALMLRAVRWLPGETILDPFAGSGTTLVAAKQLGRKAIGVEVCEAYCEIAARRLDQKVLPLFTPEPPPKQKELLT